MFCLADIFTILQGFYEIISLFPKWWHLAFCLKNALLYILRVSFIANEFSSSLLPVLSVNLTCTSYYTNTLHFNFTGMCKELLVEGSLLYKHMKESIQWKGVGIQEGNTAKYNGFSSAWPEGSQFSQHLWEGHFERLCWKYRGQYSDPAVPTER